jgi:hypothetical protein
MLCVQQHHLQTQPMAASAVPQLHLLAACVQLHARPVLQDLPTSLAFRTAIGVLFWARAYAVGVRSPDRFAVSQMDTKTRSARPGRVRTNGQTTASVAAASSCFYSTVCAASRALSEGGAQLRNHQHNRHCMQGDMRSKHTHLACILPHCGLFCSCAVWSRCSVQRQRHRRERHLQLWRQQPSGQGVQRNMQCGILRYPSCGVPQ